MRYFTALLLLFALGLTFPACAQKTTPQQTKTKKSPKKTATPQGDTKTEVGPVLTFERTPCFGTCPAYTMKVFADGRVAYEGRHAVPVMGQKELKLPATTVADMLRQTQEAHFDQFQDRYSHGATDLPSTVVGVRQANGQLKTVVVEDGAPDELVVLISYLRNQFDPLVGLSTTPDR
ncbi:DUF6438 domain-containing protein [Hymenobacter terrenus]|uniref:DUF6438 domain-containing protein n=1 Tax=Hymenobacter terrenus TaxID=1629124 RepID=UPI000619C894|nr:DUF6438 domain-containing protein [Hymenobacter terrenus]